METILASLETSQTHLSKPAHGTADAGRPARPPAMAMRNLAHTGRSLMLQSLCMGGANLKEEERGKAQVNRA